MKSARRISLALGTAVALLLSGGVGLVARAEAPPTGKALLLGLEGACPDKTDLVYSADLDARRVIGRWVTIAGPTFGLDPHAPRPRLTAHAVDPDDPRRLFVSDGRSIQRSTDGGCNWSEVHVVATTDPPVPDVADEIVQLAVGGGRVWALVAPPEDGVGRVRVVVSDDGGGSWEERSIGLPPVHTRTNTAQVTCIPEPCYRTVLALAPSDKDHAYLGLSRYAAEPSFFATADAGRSWEARPAFAMSCCQGTVEEISVDPRNPLSVWAVATDRLSRSSDGGVTWTAYNDWQFLGYNLGGLRISSEGDLPEVQVMVGGGEPEQPFLDVARSKDGGATFEFAGLDTAIPGAPAAAGGGDPTELVVSTISPQGLFYVELDPTGGSVSALTDPGIGHVLSPQSDETAEPAHWFRGYAGLAAFIPGPLPENRFPPEAAKAPFDPVAAARASAERVPGELLPARVDLDLGAQGSRRVDYRLDLPALPTPVDIWFLVDTSGSMAGAIEGLRTGMERIVRELRASGIDAWFGVAAFPAGALLYDRYADVAPPNPGLSAAIARLDTDGRNIESHSTALYQSVTGRGQPDAGLPPGRGASFRPQALKIIVHATDEAYGFTPGGPSEDEASEAMVAAGVRHVGLDLAAGAPDPTGGVDTGGPRSTKRGHDEMARATGTFAPKEGVDCNGDGLNELREGDPITCPILRGRDSVEIAPAIISSVRAIRDDTAVGLRVASSGGIGVQIGEPTRSPVNVKVANSLPFAVTFTCPPEMTGKVAEVELLATVRGAPSAGAVARVACGTLPIPITPPVAPPPPPVVPMVIAPPQVVPDLEPAVTPLNQTAPAQVAQPTPQPGMAAQPGEVATAKQRADRGGHAPPPSESQETSQPASAPATGGTLTAGAALAVALGGWAVRRERSPAAARATGRR